MSTYESADRLIELLGVRFPIVQDGLGPYKTPRLAAAVSSAGGLGTVSIPGLAIGPVEGEARMREDIELVAASTDAPFAVNIPVGHDEYGQLLPATQAFFKAVFDARQSDAAIGRQLRTVITSAGFPGGFRSTIADAGLIHIHKVGSTRQAVKAADAGVDAIIAAGSEMGGHTHAVPISTFVLVPEVCRRVDVPVLLAGGALDGRSLAAAWCLGAAGVAMGTRFIATEENTDWNPAMRDRVISAVEGEDRLVPAVYGPARVLSSAGADQLVEYSATGELGHDELLAWKEAAMVRAMRDGDTTTGLVAAGQVASSIHSVVSVVDLLPTMMAEAVSITSADPRA